MKVLFGVSDCNTAFGSGFMEVLRLADHQVEVCSSAPEALERISRASYDALVLSGPLPLPVRTGALKAFRAFGRAALCILVAGTYCDADAIEAFQAGIDDYWVTPIAASDLATRLQVLSARKLASQMRVLRVGPMVLDEADRSVQIRGQRYEIPSKEFALLRFLTAHLGETVSYATLLSHVWHASRPLASNSLEVHISRLKRWLREHTGSHSVTIKGVRGEGYRLDLVEPSAEARGYG